MNKKGMFFTLMAMLLISLFVFSLTNPKKNITGIENQGPENTRVKSLNDFVTSVNTIYIPSIIKTCVYNELKKISLGQRQMTDFNNDLMDKTNLGNESVYTWFYLMNQSANKAYHSSIDLTNFNIINLNQDVLNEATLRFSISYIVNGENKNLYWNVLYPNYNVTVSTIGIAP
ncbi:MAG: hypothetical protein WC471_02035 [Candidatus Woesearchaeota archaeon]